MSGLNKEWCKTILPTLIAEGKLEAFESEEEQDIDSRLEEIADLIHTEGDQAYSVYWDSGAPGVGAGVDSIVRFRGLYFSNTEVEGVEGPFPSLDGALSMTFFMVTQAIVRINSDELSAADIASRLIAYDIADEEQHRLTINGEPWQDRKSVV